MKDARGSLRGSLRVPRVPGTRMRVRFAVPPEAAEAAEAAAKGSKGFRMSLRERWREIRRVNVLLLDRTHEMPLIPLEPRGLDEAETAACAEWRGVTARDVAMLVTVLGESE